MAFLRSHTTLGQKTKVDYKPYTKKPSKLVQTFKPKDTDITTVIKYPTSLIERNEFISYKTGKKVTPFQYRVYDAVCQIPKGYVTSYKILSDLLKSSPRAIGQALRLNPFCPLPVACHRIIATDKTIGGFSGSSGDSQFTTDKKAKLQAEGCKFENNYIFKSNIDGSTEFFNDFKK